MLTDVGSHLMERSVGACCTLTSSARASVKLPVSCTVAMVHMYMYIQRLLKFSDLYLCFTATVDSHLL